MQEYSQYLHNSVPCVITVENTVTLKQFSLAVNAEVQYTHCDIKQIDEVQEQVTMH